MAKKPSSGLRPVSVKPSSAKRNVSRPATSASRPLNTNRKGNANEPQYRMKPFHAGPVLRVVPSFTVANAWSVREDPFDRNSRDVALTSLRKSKSGPILSRLKGFDFFRGRTLTTGGPGRGHIHEQLLWLEPADEGPAYTKNSRICFACSCPAFTFYGMEWWNSRVGLSPLYYSNGQKPTKRRPYGEQVLCKHATRLVAYLLRKGLKEQSSMKRGSRGKA